MKGTVWTNWEWTEEVEVLTMEHFNFCKNQILIVILLISIVCIVYLYHGCGLIMAALVFSIQILFMNTHGLKKKMIFSLILFNMILISSLIYMIFYIVTTELSVRKEKNYHMEIEFLDKITY